MHDLATTLTGNGDELAVVGASLFGAAFMIWFLVHLLLDGRPRNRRPLVHIETKPSSIHLMGNKAMIARR